MGVWSKIGSAALWASCISPAHGDPLELARQALARADEKAAWQHYQSIAPKDEAWPEKLEDGIRYQLLANNYREAWRLFQVAKRTAVPMEDLAYYGMLSALKAGSCPLAMASSKHIRDHLIVANVIRNQQRFRGDYMISAFEERRMHLAGNLTHYLADIPQARLISGRGCRVARYFLPEDADSPKEELEPLTKFVQASLDGATPNSPVGVDAVYVRYLELATQEVGRQKQQTEPESKESEAKGPDHELVALENPLLARVVERYKALDAAGWAKVPEPERRFVWQRLEDGGWLAKGPWSVESREAQIALHVVMSSQDRQVAYWLGKLPYDDLPPEPREKLLDHLLGIPEFPYRSQILMRKARILFARGDWNDTLGILRELLLEGASSQDQNAQRAALNLAAQLFSEHRYNDQLLGAIQGAIPAALWNDLLYTVLLDQALAGYRKGFDHLEDTLTSKKRQKPPSTILRSLTVLRPLAHRQINTFAKQLMSDRKDDGASHQMLNFLTDLGKRLSAFPPADLKKIEPYLTIIRDYLRDQLAIGRNQKRLLDLLALYDYGTSSDHDKGRAAALRGTSHLGVIDLGDEVELAQPYTWYAPDSLPRRELLFVPTGVGSRDWVIQ